MKNTTKNDSLCDKDNESQNFIGDIFSTRIDIL